MLTWTLDSPKHAFLAEQLPQQGNLLGSLRTLTLQVYSNLFVSPHNSLDATSASPNLPLLDKRSNTQPVPNGSRHELEILNATYV
jgi:hypothetical protein